MRILVISATSQIARSCVEVWAGSGNHEFILVGRDHAKLGTVAADFELRFPESKFFIQNIDLGSVHEIDAFCKKAASTPLDQVLIAQGSLTDQERAKTDLQYLESELTLNAISAALWLESTAALLERQGFGKLAVIGSVASDRGRAYNYSYASSKALLDTYVQGLQQRFADSKIRVSLIQPGPTATPMTRDHRGKMTAPDVVATAIVQGLKKGKRRIYAPGIWRWIMLVVKLIPWTIFKRLTF